jgi:hypothetical protein
VPAARNFLNFFRQVPTIVTAGKIHSAASRTDFDHTKGKLAIITISLTLTLRKFLIVGWAVPTKYR